MNDRDIYDVIIVGGGPAGLAAALYTARDRYSTLVLEKNGLPGGQIMLTETVENYPGWDKITGPDLIQQQVKQVEKFGAEIAAGQAVTSMKRIDGLIELEINGGEAVRLARSVILSPGSDYRQLGVPGETEMRQAGKVSYCATCDGAFYRDKHVLAVGGGNTAVEDTVYLASRFVAKATLIHRRKEFRAQQVLVEELYETAKTKAIEIKLPYVLEEIVGNADKSAIDHVRLRNVDSGQVERLHVDGVFVFVGMIPNTQWLRGVVEMDEAGYVLCDCLTLKTSMPGVFVAGDCRYLAAMQLATACGDGVVAALGVKKHIKNPQAWASGATTEAELAGW